MEIDVEVFAYLVLTSTRCRSGTGKIKRYAADAIPQRRGLCRRRDRIKVAAGEGMQLLLSLIHI